MRYEIDKDNFTVSIFQDGEDIPFWLQPNYPNNDPFDSIEEATEWALLAIEAQENTTAPMPPIGKGIAGEPREPAVDTSAALEVLSSLGITVEELKAILNSKD